MSVAGAGALAIPMQTLSPSPSVVQLALAYVTGTSVSVLSGPVYVPPNGGAGATAVSRKSIEPIALEIYAGDRTADDALRGGILIVNVMVALPKVPELASVAGPAVDGMVTAAPAVPGSVEPPPPHAVRPNASPRPSSHAVFVCDTIALRPGRCRLDCHCTVQPTLPVPVMRLTEYCAVRLPGAVALQCSVVPPAPSPS